MSESKKNPILSAAVMKVSLSFREERAGMFKEVYEGVLRDFELTDEQVNEYIKDHREEVERLARGKSRDE